MIAANRHATLILLSVYNQINQVFSGQVSDLDADLTHREGSINKLQQERLSEETRRTAAFVSKERWGTWMNRSEWVTAGSSLGLGLFTRFATSQPQLGTPLIASGLIKLAQKALQGQNIGSFFTQSKETQEKISSWINSAMGIASTFLGMKGGVSLIQSDLVKGMGEKLTSWIPSGQQALNLLMNGLQLGSAYIEKKAKDATATLQERSGQIMNCIYQMGNDSKESERILSLLTKISESIKSILK